MADFKIKDKWKKFIPILQGPDYAKHFYLDSGRIICVRDGCDDCPLKEICTQKEVELYVGDIIPHVRKCVAFEDVPFIQLRLKPEFYFKDFSKDTPETISIEGVVVPEGWSHWTDVTKENNQNLKSFLDTGVLDSYFEYPHVKYSLMHEQNRHYMLQDPNFAQRGCVYKNGEVSKGLFLMRNQPRFYSSKSEEQSDEEQLKEFEESGLNKYFDVVQFYRPEHNITSVDISAAEPKISTILFRDVDGIGEKAYNSVFFGEELPIYKEITVDEENNLSAVEPKN